MSISKFNLVVIQPRTQETQFHPDQKYQLVCELGIYAESVSSAIKRVRLDFQGSGCVVLQASQFHQTPSSEDVAKSQAEETVTEEAA